MRVANCTTAAQYFHLLRRRPRCWTRAPRPLVVMTPKSLLRHPLAASPVDGPVAGSLPAGPRRCAGGRATATRVSRVVLCSGKVFVDLMSSDAPRVEPSEVAVVRVEELYPFPEEELRRCARTATRTRARSSGCRKSRATWAPGRSSSRACADRWQRARLRYVGRPERASPAEGWPSSHTDEQRRIVTEACEGAPVPELKTYGVKHAVEVRVPTLGESVVEASVGAWLKQEGDPVAAGETLVELETDKVNVDVDRPDDGVLQQDHDAARARRSTPATCSPRSTRAPSRRPPGLKPTEQAAAPRRGAATPQPRPPAPVSARTAPAAEAAGRRPRDARRAGAWPRSTTSTSTKSPAVAIAAASRARTSSATPEPSDAAARTRSDQRRRPDTDPPPPSPAQPATPMPELAAADRWRGAKSASACRRRRQTIAQRLVEAQHTAAMLTTFNEVDMTAVMDVRARRRDALQGAARRRPRLHVVLHQSRGRRAARRSRTSTPRSRATRSILKHYYDIGIAVGAAEGLVVPVVRDADRKTFAEIEQDDRRAGRRRRATNTLTLDDLRGGTFTITNGGVFGSLLSTPILNPPQVGILGHAQDPAAPGRGRRRRS